MEMVCLEIHQTRRFAKRLVAMAKAGKHERIAAERAIRILADLRLNPLHEEAECKRTRHGELRLNDCRKYDLSCGFRLIALKRERKLIFTYIGSHDNCQRWIENNRYFQHAIQSTPIPLSSIKEGPIHCALPLADDQSPQDDEYEEQIKEKIDEQVLRSIFAGLCKKV